MLETQEEENKNILNISDNLKYISELTMNEEDNNKKIIRIKTKLVIKLKIIKLKRKINKKVS